MAVPTAFLSYAHESEEHHEWVRRLAMQLRLDGVAAKLDQWELVPGDPLTAFMESSIRESDFVVVICTPRYKTKSDNRDGGVGYEGAVITAELITGIPPRKFVPVLRGATWRESAPSWLMGNYYVDGRDDPFDRTEYQKLVRALHREYDAAPPVGREHSSPDPSAERSVKLAAQDRSGNIFVLRRLVETDGNDPYVRETAMRWLSENIDDASWPFLFVRFAEYGVVDPYILELGLRWLDSHEGGSAWSHVWMALMEHRSEDPYLRELGKRYLSHNQ